jgi:hypothetical protein
MDAGEARTRGSARSGATGATEDDASDRPVQTRRPRLHFESSSVTPREVSRRPAHGAGRRTKAVQAFSVELV